MDQIKPVSNRLIVEWMPVTQIRGIFTPHSELDFWNTDSVKMFRVVAAGPGRTTRKGVFVPNEINPGDNVILNCRTADKPEPLGNNRFIIKNPDEVVIGVCPIQTQPAPVSP